MADDLDALAELIHEIRCRRVAEAGDRPTFIPDPWEHRPEHLKDVDRAMAAAVRDAVLERAIPEAVDGDRARIAAECERLAAWAPTEEQEAAYRRAAAMARGQYGPVPEEEP